MPTPPEAGAVAPPCPGISVDVPSDAPAEERFAAAPRAGQRRRRRPDRTEYVEVEDADGNYAGVRAVHSPGDGTLQMRPRRPVSTVSDILIMTEHGDTLAQLSTRPGEAAKAAAEEFQQWHSRSDDRCPVVRVGDTTFLWVEVDRLLFVTHTRGNVSPSFALEFLHALARVIRDFIGELSESSVQRNRQLVYEVLSESVDHGWPQTTCSEDLRTFVHDEPVLVEAAGLYREVADAQTWREAAVHWGAWAGDRLLNPALRLTPLPKLANSIGAVTGLDRVASNVAGAVATRLATQCPRICEPKHNQPIVATQLERQCGGRLYSGRRLFVDVLESLLTECDQDGAVTREEAVGSVTVKSFMPGSPSVTLALNNNLFVPQLDDDSNVPVGPSTVVLDRHGFNSCVHDSDWKSFRTIKFSPPVGELQVMRYRCSRNLSRPFRAYCRSEVTGPCRFDTVVRVRADLPEGARVARLLVGCRLPGCVAKVSFDYGTVNPSLSPPDGQLAEFTGGFVRWQCSSVRCGSEVALRAKCSTNGAVPSGLRGLGPVSLEFEIQGWVPSRLAVQSVRVTGGEGQPQQYLRYVCRSSCYVQRLGPLD
eukprot:TRINITY_DN12771_c0_g1_i1.p1 TRINITY_DN12771_c0_g1~~TRINITY_DN12771_c0_g1_i1.p1  ORF type:complete len:614 (+),score=165.51 TRINITY_DN12771_c0_g1_i1:66-1844(+)